MAQSIIVNKWGNNLAVRIPSYVAELLELKPGSKVKLYYRDNIILIEVDKTNSQQFDHWLEKFNRGEASLGEIT